MEKIKDRQYLGGIAGLAGGLCMIIVDRISYAMGLSKRLFAETAAGVWVGSKRQAKSFNGHVLGTIMTLSLAMMGGAVKTSILTTYGRDKIIPKGLMFGISFGAIITGLTSGFAMNKVRPKNANSNLSYVVASGIYGIVTALLISKLGDDSIFDAEPQNDYIKPTIPTAEEQRRNENVVGIVVK